MQHGDQICFPPPGGGAPGRAQQIWSVCCILLRVFSMYFDGKLFCMTKNVAGERGLHSQHAPNPCQSMIGVDFTAMGRLRPATVPAETLSAMLCFVTDHAREHICLAHSFLEGLALTGMGGRELKLGR